MTNALLDRPGQLNDHDPYHSPHHNPDYVSNEELARLSQPDPGEEHIVLQDDGRLEYWGGHSSTAEERRRDGQVLDKEKARIAAETTPTHISTEFKITPEQRVAQTEKTLREHIPTFTPHNPGKPLVGDGWNHYPEPIHVAYPDQTPLVGDGQTRSRETIDVKYEGAHRRARNVGRIGLIGRISGHLRSLAHRSRHHR